MTAHERPEGPQFDDTRTALVFALNYEGEVKASVMSRMLGNVKKTPTRPGKATLKRLTRGMDAQTAETARELLEAQYQAMHATKRRPAGPPRLRGLDASHMAGLILAQFARLDPKHQTVLKGLACRTHDPCSCKAPCCSGWRQRPAWGTAVRDTCFLLASAGEILEPLSADSPQRPTWAYAKRGISTEPEMRLQIVQDFYRRRSTTLEDLARIGRVSVTTAARHKEWIRAYLGQLETEAWVQLQEIFDQGGITGSFD